MDLPDVLVEIAARTDFTSKFTHVSERESRMHHLPASLCANLFAEACDIRRAGSLDLHKSGNLNPVFRSIDPQYPIWGFSMSWPASTCTNHPAMSLTMWRGAAPVRRTTCPTRFAASMEYRVEVTDRAGEKRRETAASAI